MGRGRLKMELIENEKSRKTTFQKRRKGIMKKAYEFSTLCGVDACMIIYGPKLTNCPPELHTWPENPNEVNRIINKYKASTIHKPAKKTFDLANLLMDRKTKVYADIYRARKEMYATKYPTWDDCIDSFSENQLKTLLNGLDAKLEFGKRTLLNKRKRTTYDQVLAMEKQAPKLMMGGNHNIGASSSQKPISSLNDNMVDMLQPFPVSSSDQHHPHHHDCHQACDHQMLQFENSDQYLNNLTAPNPGPMGMWMLMESNYNYNYSSTLQLSGGCSSSNAQLPLEGYNSSSFSDPAMTFNNNINVPPGSSTSMSLSQYYARLLQPAVPYMQYPMVHASQVKENHDHGYVDDDVINQYLVMNNKMV